MRITGRRIAAGGFAGAPLRGSPPALVVPALALAACLLALALRGGMEPAPGPSSDPLGGARAERAYGELPLAFEPNAGRTASQADYVARAGGSTHFLGSGGATIALPDGALRIGLVGAAPARPRALERLPGVVNSLVGDHPSRWRTGIPTFERVRYPAVWPGIDVEWYGDRRRLEYDFVLANGADPGRIAMRFSGQDSIRIGPGGGLVARAGANTIRQLPPVAYQRTATGRVPVRTAYVLDGHTARLSLGPYDQSRPLRIDPLVYLGMAADSQFNDVEIDSAGEALITGSTRSGSFPTTGGALQPSDPDPGNTIDDDDAFVTKLNAGGTAALYSTYLGGGGHDASNGISIDSGGEATVTGLTSSASFPTTSGLDQTLDGSADSFVTRLNADGSSLVWSTYLGGSAFDAGAAIAVDSGGSQAVVGSTDSTNFPTSDASSGLPCDIDESDPDGGAGSDGFYAALDSTGARVCSTYLGGDGADGATDIALRSDAGFAVVGFTESSDFPTSVPLQTAQGGRDAFVYKFSLVAFITYLGGSGTDSADGVAIDSDGNVYVGGSTDSDHDGGGGDFPITAGAAQASDPDPGAEDGFVARLNRALLSSTKLGYATYLGGSGTTCSSCEVARGVAVDSTGAAYIAGDTTSSDFPTTPGALDTTPSGSGDAFLSKLKPDGSGLAYSTLLSGGGTDTASAVAVSGGAAFVTGETTDGLGQRVTPGSFDEPAGGFLAKLTPVPRPAVNCQGKSATAVGTNGADLLIGTNGPDVFSGMGGADRILGVAGADIACGGGGNDRVDGGPGRDRLNGEGGKDALTGGGGSDSLKGGGGRDRCIGGGARDRARGCERRRSI